MQILATILGSEFWPLLWPGGKCPQNKDIVVSGLTTGLVGYAIANYGFGNGHLFQIVFPP